MVRQCNDIPGLHNVGRQKPLQYRPLLAARQEQTNVCHHLTASQRQAEEAFRLVKLLSPSSFCCSSVSAFSIIFILLYSIEAKWILLYIIMLNDKAINFVLPRNLQIQNSRKVISFLEFMEKVSEMLGGLEFCYDQGKKSQGKKFVKEGNVDVTSPIEMEENNKGDEDGSHGCQAVTDISHSSWVS